MTPLILAAVTLVLQGQQNTPEVSSTYWYDQCSRETLACHGYVQGTFEATRFLAGKNGIKTVCPPGEINSHQLAAQIVKLMNEPGNEMFQSMSFSGLVIAALESSYPCR